MKWPSYIISNGEVLRLSYSQSDTDALFGFYADRRRESAWHRVTELEVVPVVEFKESGMVYYESVRDPLIIAMVKSLAAKHPDKSAG